MYRVIICAAALIVLSDDRGSYSADEPQKPEKRRAGAERSDNSLEMPLVWCPPGKFKMGSPKSEKDRNDSEDQVDVTLTNGFWLGKYEVTQAEYQRMMGKNPSFFSPEGTAKVDGPELRQTVELGIGGKKTDRFPVDGVDWDDALEFCKKLTDREREAKRLPPDWEYTLPTEAEWEYACRAGTKTPFSFGKSCNGKEANCAGVFPYGTNAEGPYVRCLTTVGSYSPNKWGLHDMHGNVKEWCRDFVGKLRGGTDPEQSDPENGRIQHFARGGSCFEPAQDCRAAARGNSAAAGWCTGFRVALRPVRE